jgi:phosphoinositide-3-kinase, regulatory subunit 4
MPVVVKVYLKRPEDLQFALAPYHKVLNSFSEKLSVTKQPNVLFYHRMVETDKGKNFSFNFEAGYLVRQYFYSNLSDRINTRPFFTKIGKKWISYQIIEGLRQLHEVDVIHGDLKTENIVNFKELTRKVMTGWDWVFLTDIAPFKKYNLPIDDPSDFSYFFDTAERRICLIAPERFVQMKSKEEEEEEIKYKSSDIFSLGCVLAQLYLDGVPLFDLSQLLAYKKGDLNHLNAMLKRIQDEEIREMIRSMLEIIPKKRLTAEEYLKKFKFSVFPSYFEVFHTFLQKMLNMDSDQRVSTIYHHFEDLLNIFDQNIQSEEISSQLVENLFKPKFHKENEKKEEEVEVEMKKKNLKEIIQSTEAFLNSRKNLNTSETTQNSSSTLKETKKELNVNPCEIGIDFLAAALCSNVRNSKSVSTRTKGLQLIQQLSVYSNDVTKYQRLVPYVCVLLSDSSPLVRNLAVRTLAFVLQQIKTHQVGEVNMFSDYILPILRTISMDPSDLVKISFAEHLPIFAFESKRLLELSQMGLSTEGNYSNFDSELSNLQDEFSSLLSQISMDPNTFVKRGLMRNVMKLCLFYGRRKTNDLVLPMIITFLNSREWLLRHAFFEQMSGISIFVGPTSLKEFILPCLLQALHDVEEFVIVEALKTLVSVTEVGLFKKNDILKVSIIVSPLLHHPNTWIRYSAVAFFANASKQLGLLDTACYLSKIMQPHLMHEILIMDQESLLESIKPPLSRHLYEKISKFKGNFKELLADWKGKLGRVTEEEVNLLNIMKIYLMQVSKTIQAKNWDTTSDSIQSMETIKLDPSLVQTHRVPLEKTKANLKAPKSQNLQYQDEWNAMFNSPESIKVSIRKKISNSSTNIGSLLPPKEKFKPLGNLLAQSQEHKGSINELAVHASKQWFISGGADKSVKVWNSKLDGDFSLKSKLTYTLDDSFGKILSLGITSNNSCCSTDQGWIHVFDSEIGSTLNTINISEKKAFFSNESENRKLQSDCSLNVLRTCNLAQSNLILTGNQNGIIHGLDPRFNKQIFCWENPIEYGPITSMVCEDSNWMVTGTKRGFLTLWDLRFKLAVDFWRIGTSSINSIGVIPNLLIENAPSLCIGNDSKTISLWSLEHKKITKSFNIGFQEIPQSTNESKMDPYGLEELKGLNSKENDSTKAIYVCPETGNFITGGSDRRIRYWNVSSPENSYAIVKQFPNEKFLYTKKTLTDSMTQSIEEIPKTDRQSKKSGFSSSVPVSHLDTVTDIKVVTQSQNSILVSSSRDGVLKMWY